MTFGFLKPADESFPPIVHVETTNICNLRCIHCPHSDVHAAIPGYSAKTIDMVAIHSSGSCRQSVPLE